MIGGKNWARAFVCAGLAIVLGGCGAPGSGGEEALPSEVADGGESLGTERQALSPLQMEDRPTSAAVARNLPNGQEIWVFACDSSFHIKRKIRDSFGLWGAWKTIAGTVFCAGPPTVAYLKNVDDVGNVDPETLVIYWRDWDMALWEVRFFPDGHTERTNLSETLSLGRMANNPVLANLGNDTGAYNAIAIAFASFDTDELFTVQYKASAWSARPVTRADGSTAKAYGTTFVTAFGPPSGVYDRSFISARGENNLNFIYARKSWGAGYTEYAKTNTAAVKGLLSIAHYNLFDGDPTCYPRGCAMYRDATTNKLMYAGLATGGDLTNKFKVWDDKRPEAKAEAGHFAELGGSLGPSPERSWDVHGWARSSDSWLLHLIWSTGSSTRCTQVGQIIAAPVTVLNNSGPWGSDLLIEDTGFNLKHFDVGSRGCSAAAVTDLGLQPVSL